MKALLRRAWPMLLGLTLLSHCEQAPDPIRSVVLSGGSYVRIPNRQVVGQPRDSTSLAFLSDDVFSLEIRAAGDTVPAAVQESPALFMIGNAQGGDEIAVARSLFFADRIFVFLGDSSLGSYTIPGCNWNDSDVFTQIVMTYDGTTFAVYGNGEQLSSQSVAIDVDVADSDALIGADWDGPNDTATLGNFWYGAIDEVRLWATVLPASEMLFRYQNPDKLTRNYSPTGLDPLIGLWRFNRAGQDGDLVPDGSGKGNDAVLHEAGGQLDFTDAGP